MNFDTLISERYSVRQFEPTPLTPTEIDALLAAGCNNQPQRKEDRGRFCVLTKERGFGKLRLR